MTMFEIADEVNKEFDEVMQEKYKQYYIKCLSEAKLNQDVAAKNLERANKSVAEASEELHKIRNNPSYVKEKYFSKQYSHELGREDKSQYHKDLFSIQK